VSAGDVEASARPGRGRRRALAWLILREAAVSFARHRHWDTSAILAYYGCLSFLPLLLLVSVLTSRRLLMSAAAMEAVRAAADELVAGFGALALEQIRTLSEQRVWSVVGLLALFWSVTPFAAGLRGAMQRIFQPERPAGIFRAKLRDVLGATALIAVFLMLVLGRILYGAAARRLPGGVPLVAGALQMAFSYALAVAALAVLFTVFAPVRLRTADMLSGALVSAAMLLAIRPAFAAFLKYNPNYGWAFGSFKAVFLTLTWVYASFAAMLFGAEIVAAARRRDVALLRTFLSGAPGLGAAPLVARHLRRVCAGEVIFREGDAGGEMFVIRSGRVRISAGGRELRTMGPGEYFGELTMLLNAPRTATAEAVEDGALVVIRKEHFDTMLREQPELALPLLRELAERLRATDARLAGGASNPPARAEGAEAAPAAGERKMT